MTPKSSVLLDDVIICRAYQSKDEEKKSQKVLESVDYPEAK